MEIRDYYANLLIVQYHGKPKASETIKLLADTATGDGLIGKVFDSFNLDNAVGVQLDTIGSFVGSDRIGLSDDDYRVLIKFKIIVNNIDAGMKSIDDAIFNTFGTSIVVNNNQDMTMTYIINPSYSVIVEAAYRLGFLPLPMGVGVNVILQVPYPAKIFGFKRGDMVTNAIGFSTQDQKRDGTFITKENILVGGTNA